jgi:hypothetical protein
VIQKLSKSRRASKSHQRFILLKVWVLPISGVASGRVCACSLRSRLVFSIINKFVKITVKIAVNI